MIKIKIIPDLATSQNLYIRDVIESDEHLMEGYGFRYGARVDEYTDTDSFFDYLEKKIREGYVFKLMRSKDNYCLGYLEDKEGILHYREIELDLEEAPVDFQIRLEKMADVLYDNRKRLSKKTFKLIAEKVSSNDVIAECCKHLYDYSSTNKVARDIPEGMFEDFHNFLEENYNLLKNAPMKLPEISLLDKEIYGLAGICVIILFFLGSLVSPLTGALISISTSIYAVRSFIDERSREIEGYKPTTLSNFINDFRRAYSAEIRELYISQEKNEKQKKKRTFVDFVMTDLEFVRASDYRDQLSNLAIDYSEQKDREIFENYIPVDKYKYIMNLILLEISIFTTKEALMFKSGTNITTAMLNERLEFLGWSATRIERDDFVKEVHSAMEEISIRPYTDVEIELLGLMKLVIQYAGIDTISAKSIENMVLLKDAIVDKAHIKIEVARRNEQTLAAKMVEEENMKPVEESIEGDRAMQIAPINNEGL